MKKNKSLYIIVALLALFMIGNVKAAETLKYSCVYKMIQVTDSSTAVDSAGGARMSVHFYSETKAIWKKDESKTNFFDFDNKITYWGEKKNDKSYFKNKKCYTYLYKENKTLGITSYALTNSKEALISAPEAYKLVAAETEKQNKEIINNKDSVKTNNTILTQCPYKSETLGDVILSYNTDGIPVTVTTNGTGIKLRVTAALKEILVKEPGECQNKIYSCYNANTAPYQDLYSTNMDAKGNEMNCKELTVNKNVSEKTVKSQQETLKNSGYTYSDDLVDIEDIKINYNDVLYADKFNILTNKQAEYKACISSKSKAECADLATEYTNAYKNLKEYCNKALKVLDYGDTSLNSCLSFKNDMDSIGYGSLNTNICGISDDMRDLLSNIFNIIRFAIPVLVIVLGLFDFLRAAASGTEDHMKRAQKQLITRLIAAALIFLAPLVIAFFLEQFGFVPEGCGIVNL